MGDGLSIQKGNVWLTISAASVVWVIAAGQWNLQRTVLLTAAALGSLAVGCIVGFLFSSYGEEASTIGKVRDWLIGGLTGLTLAKVESGALKNLLLTFCAGPGPIEYGLVMSVVILYLTVGFFFMYLQRELFVNVLLAQKRAERGRVEGTVQTGFVIGNISAKLPASLLTGAEQVEQVLDTGEAQKLRELLYSDDLNQFLTSVDTAQRQGALLEYDVVSKAAFVYYYRAYFESDADKKSETIHEALNWLSRSLQMNPLHADLTMKYADMLFMDGQYAAAVAILEPMVQRPEAPTVVSQWLGHFLLQIPSRVADAAKYLKQYLEYFPNDADGIANLACAYARMYAAELKQHGLTIDKNSENRRIALAKLAEAIALDADYRETARTKLSISGASFEILSSDDEFMSLTCAPKAVAAAATGTTQATNVENK